jgi:hypothetical protein
MYLLRDLPSESDSTITLPGEGISLIPLSHGEIISKGTRYSMMCWGLGIIVLFFSFVFTGQAGFVKEHLKMPLP